MIRQFLQQFVRVNKLRRDRLDAAEANAVGWVRLHRETIGGLVVLLLPVAVGVWLGLYLTRDMREQTAALCEKIEREKKEQAVRKAAVKAVETRLIDYPGSMPRNRQIARCGTTGGHAWATEDPVVPSTAVASLGREEYAKILAAMNRNREESAVCDPVAIIGSNIGPTNVGGVNFCGPTLVPFGDPIGFGAPVIRRTRFIPVSRGIIAPRGVIVRRRVGR